MSLQRQALAAILIAGVVCSGVGAASEVFRETHTIEGGHWRTKDGEIFVCVHGAYSDRTGLCHDRFATSTDYRLEDWVNMFYGGVQSIHTEVENPDLLRGPDLALEVQATERIEIDPSDPILRKGIAGTQKLDGLEWTMLLLYVFLLMTAFVTEVFTKPVARIANFLESAINKWVWPTRPSETFSSQAMVTKACQQYSADLFAIGKYASEQSGEAGRSDPDNPVLRKALGQIRRLERIAKECGVGEISEKLMSIACTARRIVGEADQDEADLRRARRFFSVFLPNTERVAIQFVELSRKERGDSLVGSYVGTLTVVDELATRQLDRLLQHEEMNLDVALEVLGVQAKNSA